MLEREALYNTTAPSIKTVETISASKIESLSLGHSSILKEHPPDLLSPLSLSLVVLILDVPLTGTEGPVGGICEKEHPRKKDSELSGCRRR